MKKLLLAAAVAMSITTALDAAAYTPVYEQGMLTAVRDIQLEGHPEHRFTATFVDRTYIDLVGEQQAYMSAVAAYTSPDNTYKDDFTMFVTSLLSNALGQITPALDMESIRGCRDSECWLMTPNSSIYYAADADVFIVGTWNENRHTGEYRPYAIPPQLRIDGTTVGNNVAWVKWSAQ